MPPRQSGGSSGCNARGLRTRRTSTPPSERERPRSPCSPGLAGSAAGWRTIRASLLFPPLRAKHPAHEKPQNAAEHEPARESQVKAFVLGLIEIEPSQPSQAKQEESPEEKLPVANLLSRIAVHLALRAGSYFVCIVLIVHIHRLTAGCQ